MRDVINGPPFKIRHKREAMASQQMWNIFHSYIKFFFIVELFFPNL